MSDLSALFEYFGALKKRTLALLRYVQTGEDSSAEVEKANLSMLLLNKPKIFQGKDSEEIKYDKEFTELCVFLQQETGESDVESWPVLKFYTALELIKKQRAKQ